MFLKLLKISEIKSFQKNIQERDEVNKDKHTVNINIEIYL